MWCRVLRQFFSGPAAALDPLAFLYGPSGSKYSVRDLEELDLHVHDLRRRQVNAQQRGHLRLAWQFGADADALLDRRYFMMMCPASAA